jgi:hypothetical protein
MTVGLGARQRGAGGQELGGGISSCLCPLGSLQPCWGQTLLEGEGQGGVWGSLATPPPKEATELPALLPLIAWQCPSPMWPFLKLIKAS